MRKGNLATVMLFTITVLAGAIVGSALRSGMQDSAAFQAGEPNLLASK